MIEIESAVPDTLRGIELTEEGKKPIREIQYVDDVEKLLFLEDAVRAAILDVLRTGIEDTITIKTTDPETGDKITRERKVIRNELSVVEMVKISESKDGENGISMSQIYHHLPKLIENGFVIKYGEVKKGGRKTDYYRRVGQVIILQPVPSGTTHLDDEMRERNKKSYMAYLKRMQELFKANLSKEDYNKMVDLLVQRDEIENASYLKTDFREMFAQDIASTYDIMIMQDMMMLYHITNPKWIEIYKKLREIIFKEEEQ